MIAMLLMAAATIDCSPGAISQRVQTASAILGSDLPQAKATIEPVLTCPVDNIHAYYAHVLRADMAVREQDWAAVAKAMANIGFHPESKISLRAAVHTATASVTAYEARVDQGRLHRLLEFIIVPDDAGAYPQSILLTDDMETGAKSEALKLISGGHGWFVDAYQCSARQTLDAPLGREQPSYDYVKGYRCQGAGREDFASIEFEPTRRSDLPELRMDIARRWYRYSRSRELMKGCSGR